MSVLDDLRCPRCAHPIDVRRPDIECGGCGQRFPRLGETPVLLSRPDLYLASCRRQLTVLEDRAERTVRGIEEQLTGADVLPVTRERCAGMIDALRCQVADVRAILDPMLPVGGVVETEPAASSDDVPATMEFLPYLYRDWGWPADPDGENERALAAVEEVLRGGELGRTLVLGAGACRLPYDLHHRHPSAEIVALDVDPVLIAAASSITRGHSIPLHEANLETGEIGLTSREWVLQAPAGPVDAERFHFIVADGLAPPFSTGMWDTVVTPWFIDQAPADLRDFIGTLHDLLRPGGRWVNLGPLRYGADVPVALRFSREELFDLAERSGFHIDQWQTGSVPYLVSKVNGRGKVEWVLAFSATRLMEPAPRDEDDGIPPAWLTFGHLPIPTFAGQTLWTGPPAFQVVVSAIDGRRTLRDVATLVAEKSGNPDVPMPAIRDAVRQCLMEVHPECPRRASGEGRP